MDRKEELQMKYQETKTQAGSFQIKNAKNQRSFVDCTRNLKTMQRHRFMLEHGTHPNESLQTDWNKFGANAFSFEVLEVLENDPDEYYNIRDVLKKLKEKWVQEVQPFGANGYN